MGTENTLVAAKGEEREGGTDLEFGVSRFRLLNIEWISNKVLLLFTHINLYEYAYMHIFICIAYIEFINTAQGTIFGIL